jgi:hypothetical protein
VKPWGAALLAAVAFALSGWAATNTTSTEETPAAQAAKP